MRLTIKTKLISAFVVITVLVLLAGITGIVMVNRVASSSRMIIDDQMPVKDVSMGATGAMQKSIAASRKYLNQTTGLEPVEKEIQKSIDEIFMYVSLLRFGSESSEFKNSEAAATYRALGLKYTVPEADDEVRKLAEAAAAELVKFKQASRDVVAAHKRKSEYSFTHKGVLYDVRTFLSYLSANYAAWYSSLQEAAEFNTKFGKGTNEAESDLSIWYKDYKTSDKKLAELLSTFNERNVRIYEWAEKIDGAADNNKIALLRRGGARYFPQFDSSVREIRDHVVPIISEIEVQESQGLQRMEQSAEKIKAALAQLESTIDGQLGSAKDLAGGARTSAMFVLIFISLTAVGVAIFMGVWITRDLTQQLGGEPAEIAGIANRISQGDLTVNLGASASGVGVSKAMREMTSKLKALTAQIKHASDNLAGAGQELRRGSLEMSQGVAEQSEKASQIATSAEQLSTSVSGIARNASQIAASAVETSKIANNGEAIVRKSVEEVKAIAETVRESAHVIASLGDRSKQIGQIVGVIKEIAEQTNLLALNAAIEAARAGEQGRGFAVVADEVRKLAERTASSTSEISTTINTIQVEVDKAISAMQSGTERVEVGVDLATEAGQALRGIVQSVDELQAMVQEIATATEKISNVSGQISVDIETIAKVSKETHAGSGQVAQSASNLVNLSSDLQKIVGQFKV